MCERCLLESLKETNYSEDLDADGRIKSTWISNKYGVKGIELAQQRSR